MLRARHQLALVHLPNLGKYTAIDKTRPQVLRLVLQQITLTGKEYKLGLAGPALQLVVMADAAAGDFQAVLCACLAGGNDGAVMANLLKVSAVAATWAVAGGLVANLGMLGYEPHAK